MKVKNTSWHYRLWKLGRENWSEPHNLCKYFWHLALIKILLPLTLAAMVLIGVGSLIWVMWNNPLTTALVVLFTAIGVGLVVLGYLAWPRATARWETRVERKAAAPPKEPSIVRQYLKAKKSKVCPLITVVKEGE